MIAIAPTIIALLMAVALVFTLAMVRENDLLKALAFSGGQSACFVAIYALLAAPDIVLAYVGASTVIPAVLLYVVWKTERFERGGSR